MEELNDCVSKGYYLQIRLKLYGFTNCHSLVHFDYRIQNTLLV